MAQAMVARPKHFKSESSRQCQPDRQWFGRMNMAIRDASDRLARQSRQIVVFDLVGVRIEEIQHVELQPNAVVEPVAGARIEDQRLQRADAVVLDQGTRAEIARLERTEPAGIA